MIIFYNKNTGEIVGTINGRVHKKEHLDMWIGSREDNERIICQWEKNDKGEMEPNIQKDLFKKIENESGIHKNYKFDVNKKSIREKTIKEKEDYKQKNTFKKIEPVINNTKMGTESNKILVDILERLKKLEKKIS